MRHQCPRPEGRHTTEQHQLAVSGQLHTAGRWARRSGRCTGHHLGADASQRWGSLGESGGAGRQARKLNCM